MELQQIIQRMNKTCTDHDVATCSYCKRAYELSELSYHTEQQIAAGVEVIEWPDPQEWTRCPACGRDLSVEIELHSEACPDFND